MSTVRIVTVFYFDWVRASVVQVRVTVLIDKIPAHLWRGFDSSLARLPRTFRTALLPSCAGAKTASSAARSDDLFVNKAVAVIIYVVMA